MDGEECEEGDVGDVSNATLHQETISMKKTNLNHFFVPQSNNWPNAAILLFQHQAFGTLSDYLSTAMAKFIGQKMPLDAKYTKLTKVLDIHIKVLFFKIVRS